LEGETDIKACDYELHLPKPSYTWNTLQHLKEDYPQHTFVLLIGGDNWQRFPQWYRADDILHNYTIVVYPRRGFETDCKQLPQNVMVADTELLDISSTEIRQRIRQGESISGMVPDNIEELVRQNYRSER
jgi:nicotinate-nucleotide adenylyltransferase